MMARRGFTLIELAVVVGILALLVAVALPASRTGLARAKAARCLGHLRSLGVAFSQYLGEHQMIFPEMAAARGSREEEVPVLDTVLAPYTGAMGGTAHQDIFSCPADRSLAERTGTSYYYNSALSGQPLATLNFLGITEEKTRIPILVDKEGWHRGAGQPVNHLFADGHAGSELRLFAE